MKNGILKMSIAFILVVTAFFAVTTFYLQNKYGAYEKEYEGKRVVLLNEIIHTDDYEAIVSRLDELFSTPPPTAQLQRWLIVSYISCMLFASTVLLFCYLKLISPFNKLEHFAKEVAKGNLDFPLEIQRENVFGEFSWAFDFMRSELKNSREQEKIARQENKALIAAISHDIKTPVASIRAYAEALSRGMDTTPERRERYLSVIIKKSDEVTKLTNDLFLHALSDMEKLQLEIKPHDAKELIKEILDPFFAEYGDKLTVTDVPEVTVNADEKRLAQVFENVITNAAKYATDSSIEISFTIEEDELVCKIRDFGSGIPAVDMPFVLDRFYRGENSKDKQGSGLGLYIVKYIVGKCGGFVRLDNSENGLSVIFSVPCLRKDQKSGFRIREISMLK